LDAVLFDVYGTLLISGSGEPGTSGPTAPGEAITAALQAAGIVFRGDGAAVYELLLREIDRRHQAAHDLGVDFPEVDIVEVWRATLGELQVRGCTDVFPDATSGRSPSRTGTPARQFVRDGQECPSYEEGGLAALAVEHEMRANPVWTMPHLRETLDGLRRAGKKLGIVSNAQFYTPEIFPALLNQTLAELGFEPDLLFFSFQHGRAKPGLELFQLAVSALGPRGIPAERVLYVGNDMRNDIQPAARVGFRTALFAGDARSLRRREDDPDVAGVVPDVVVTDLRDVYTVVSCYGTLTRP
jgi:putative hydrolase of the HAD superfamily